MIPSGELSWEMGTGRNVDSPEVESIVLVDFIRFSFSPPCAALAWDFRDCGDGGGCLCVTSALTRVVCRWGCPGSGAVRFEGVRAS